MEGLETYFETSGDTPSSLAGRVGVAPSTITRPLKGERPANTDLALEVEKATEGRLTADRFLAACLSAARRLRGLPDPALSPRSTTPESCE